MKPVKTFSIALFLFLSSTGLLADWPREASTKSVSAGQYHVLAVRSDGSVWGWGTNRFGELGVSTGTLTRSLQPRRIGTFTNAISVAAGWRHSLVLLADGTIRGWGRNNAGQLGNNSTTDSATPVQVSGINNAVAIAAGETHSVALLADGTVRTWGSGSFGKLGHGSSSSSLVPVAVSGVNAVDIIQIGAGQYHTIALRGDGTVWSWGDNSFGELGRVGGSSSVPVQASGLSGIQVIASGRTFNFAANAVGQVWSWGYNINGELGLGNTSNTTLPTQIGGLTNVVALAGGFYGGAAATEGGRVYYWGIAALAVQKLTPTWVEQAEGITGLTLGDGYLVGLRKDGWCVAWGSNLNGEFGNGTIGTTTSLTLAPRPSVSPRPLSQAGRLRRGYESKPKYTSFVLGLTGQKGVLLDAIGGDFYKFSSGTPWFARIQKTTRNHVLDVNGSGTVTRMAVENPIAGFGSELGGTPLYPGESYRFGAYAGGMDELQATAGSVFTIKAYSKSGFSGSSSNINPVATTTITLPRRTVDTALWNTFIADNMTKTVDMSAYGLKTTVEFEENKPWGLDWVNGTALSSFQLVGYRLAHVATDQATNYHFVVEGKGSIQTTSTARTYFATDGGGAWASVPLYTLDFEARPEMRAAFVDQIHFDGEPLPPQYAGKTLEELEGLQTTITNSIILTNNSAYLTIDGSPELRQHPLLDKLVSDLKGDPLRLASFVINEIELADPLGVSGNTFEDLRSVAQSGVNRSALGVLLERQGSPTEQCALLVYLLRKAGYHAGYVWPTSSNLQMLDSRLSKLLRMQVSGVPYTTGQSLLTARLINVEYPWVAVNVGGQSYQVFPWLKDTQIVEGLDLYDYLPAEYSTAYQWVKSYVSADSSILNLDPENNIPRVLFPKFVEDYLRDNSPGLSIDDIGVKAFNRRVQHARWQDLPLPNVLKDQSQVTVFDSLSANQPFLANIFNTFRVQVYPVSSPSTAVMDTGFLRMADLNNRKFLLLTNNSTTMELWLAPYRPGITTVSAFNNNATLLNIQKQTYTFGAHQDFNVVMTHKRHQAAAAGEGGFLNTTETLAVTNSRPFNVSDVCGIAINVGRVTPQMLRVHADAYAQQESLKANNASYVPPVEEFQGTAAYVLGMGYFERLSRFSAVNEQLHKVRVISRFDNGFGKLSSRQSGSKVQGGVDMPMRIVAAVGNSTSRPDLDEPRFSTWNNFWWIDAANGSAEEHQIINDTLKQKSAISTVRLLQLAELRATNGTAGILELTKNNYLTLGNSVQPGWNGDAVKNQDTSLWQAVVDAFNGANADYVRVFLTPAKVTNETASYIGMGALILAKDSLAGLISGNFAPVSGGAGEVQSPFSSPNGYKLSYYQEVDPNGGISYGYNDSGLNFSSGRTTYSDQDATFLSSGNGGYMTPVTSKAGSDAGSLFGISNPATGFQTGLDLGNQGSPSWLSGVGTLVSDPVNVMSGYFYIDTVDLTLPGPFPLQIRRNYQSGNLADNQFGYGWKMNLMPYLTVAVNPTNSGIVLVYASEMDGSTVVYRKQAGVELYKPEVQDNPQLGNHNEAGIGATANWFNAEIEKYVSRGRTFYKLTAPDGSIRTYQVRSFPISGNGTTLNRERPYLGTWEDHRGNTLTFHFGEDSTARDYGQVSRIDSSNGSFVGFNYDAYGRIVEAFSSDGRRVEYQYDRLGDLTKVTLPDASERQYIYGKSPYTITNGVTITAHFESTHRIIEEIKPDGRKLKNEYDSMGRVSKQWATVGADLNYVLNATFAYTNNFSTNNPGAALTGNTYVRDVFNHATRYDYSNGLITKITDPLNQTVEQQWYSDSATSPGYRRSLYRRKDKRGLWTEFKYDSSGNVTSRKFWGDLTGDGGTQYATNTVTYNANNLPLTSTDPAGNKVVNVYSTAYPFLPEQIITYAGATPVITNKLEYYDSSQNVTFGGTNYTLQAFGLLRRETRAFNSPDAAITEWLHDGRGFITNSIRYTGTSDSNVVMNFVYNERGELIEQIDAAGRKVSFENDAMGRPKLKEVYEAGAGQPLSWEYFYYNENGELTWSDGPRFDPEDYVWRDYDGAGRQTVQIRWRTRARDDATGVEPESDEKLYAATYSEYDGFGNLTKVTGPRGNYVRKFYDSIGQMTSEVSYSSAGTPLATNKFSYEPGGQIARSTNALSGVTQFLYTTTGSLKEQTAPTGAKVKRRYYLDGRLKREYQSNNAYSETAYDDLNLRTTKVFYSAVGAALTTNITAMDRRGNVIRQTDAAGFTFTNYFDDLDRLKGTSGPVIAYDPPEGAPPLPGGPPAPYQRYTTNYYDGAGIVMTAINAGTEKTVTYRDALGRVTKTEIRNAANAVVRETVNIYAENHHSVTVINGSGNDAITSTTFTDNDGAAVLTVANSSSQVKELTLRDYDLAGNLEYEVRGSISNNIAMGWSEAEFTYDAFNRLNTKIDRDGATTTFDYDAAGNLTNRVMPGGLKWRAQYNSALQMLNEAYVSSSSTVTKSNIYSYYSSVNAWVGLLQARTDGRGVAATYTYDHWLRPATSTHTGSLVEHNLTTSFGYDLRGNLETVSENFASSSTGPATVVARVFDPYASLESESIALGGEYVSRAGAGYLPTGRRRSLGVGSFGYNYTWREDGLLATATGPTGGGSFTYTTAGLLVSRTFGPKTTTITDRDGTGRPLALTTTLNGSTLFSEALSYLPDGLLASHTVDRDDFTDYRSYAYAPLSRRLIDERLNLDGTKRWTNSFTYDGGVAAGPGVITRAGQPGANGIAWKAGADVFSRIGAETNSVARRSAYGQVNGPATVTALLDGQPMPVSVAGSNGGQWRSVLELSPGAHTLTVSARHPSGLFSTNKSVTFTNNATDRVQVSYTGEGQFQQRVWKRSNGTTERTQTLAWDAKGRLYKVTERDSGNSGYNWQAVYDGLDRRLQTTTILVTNNVALTAQPIIINQYYDPAVEFLELGVSINGKTTWKLYGPDLNGVYGGMNGTGGFDAIVPGPELFCPVMGDARGNILAVYDVTHAAFAWTPARPTGYGAVPGYRPAPLGHGGNIVQASAWRGRWADITGLVNLGARHYRPESGSFESFDPIWNGIDPNGYTFAGGEPILGFDADGRLATAVGREMYYSGSALVSGEFWGGMGRDAYGMGARLGNGVIEAGAIGSDMIGQSAASVFGYGAEYQGYSQLYQNIYSNPSQGPTSGQILAGTGEAVLNVGTLGLYGMGQGIGVAAGTGDFTQMQDAALGQLLLSGSVRIMQGQGVNPLSIGRGGSMRVDVGGEGRDFGAINLNPSAVTSTTGTAGRPIPNLVQGVGQNMPFGNSSAAQITVQSAPLNSQVISEIGRVIQPGGVIRLIHPAEYATTSHAQAIQAIGGTVVQQTVPIGGVPSTVTIITTPSGTLGSSILLPTVAGQGN